MVSIKTVYERQVAKWYSLPTQQRTKILKNLLVAGIALTAIGFYILGKGDNVKPKEKPETISKRTVEVESYVDRDVDARIERVVLEILSEKERIDGAAIAASKKAMIDQENTFDEYEDLDSLEFEPVEPPQANYTPVEYESYPMPPTESGEAKEAPQPQFVGGVSWEGASVSPKQVSNESASGFVIPVGFMPAMMIVGVQAPVANAGKGNPKPIHLRVQAPATLPNKLKLNLAGCFVIANTWGNLSSERIEAETVSLTCMTQDKKTIISGALNGYLADADGQRDIAGRVVTRAGALLGRRFIADTLTGAGEAIASNTGQVAISPLGSVTSMSGGELAERGAASGVSKGFQGAGEYISELLAQSGPIIESGAARPVMIMIQKESVLTVKSIETYQNDSLRASEG